MQDLLVGPFQALFPRLPPMALVWISLFHLPYPMPSQASMGMAMASPPAFLTLALSLPLFGLSPDGLLFPTDFIRLVLFPFLIRASFPCVFHRLLPFILSLFLPMFEVEVW